MFTLPWAHRKVMSTYWPALSLLLASRADRPSWRATLRQFPAAACRARTGRRRMPPDDNGGARARVVAPRSSPPLHPRRHRRVADSMEEGPVVSPALCHGLLALLGCCLELPNQLAALVAILEPENHLNHL